MNEDKVVLPMMEVPKKLTKWKEEPSVQQLKADLSEAMPYQSKQVSLINTWLDNLNIEGSAKPKCGQGRSAIQPALIRKQAEWRYAALSEPFLSMPDLFKVNPVSHEDRAAARQNALVLNNQFQTKIDKVPFIDSYIRAAVNEGTAIVKIGWEFREKEVEEEQHLFQYFPVQEDDEETLNNLDEAIRMMQEEPDSFTLLAPALQESAKKTMEQGIPFIAEISETRMAKVMKTVVNKPVIEVCDYRNIYIDPTCRGDLKKASFVVYTFSSSLSELKKDGRYKNLNYVENGSTSFLGAPDELFNKDSVKFNFQDNPRKKLTVYEYWGYWDIHGTGVAEPIVATWVGNVCIRMEENPFPDKELPFVVVPYLPVKNSVYGEPDGALLEDNQKIIGAITRGMIDLLGKSANSQTGFSKGFLDATNRRKYQAGQDYEFNMTTHPDSHIYMHKYPEVPQSALTILGMMHEDAESLTGVKAYSTGGGITGAGLGDTAAGVRSAMDAASKRELGILRRLSNGIVQIGRKIIAMNAEFLEEEEVVRITNGEFVQIRRDDLAGNFDLELTISTAEADASKAQELAFMLQTMGNHMNPDMSKIILSEIARLHKMPDLAHTIETFQPEPDPIQQQMQELELQRLQAEVQLLQAQAQEAATKGMVNEAKVGVEHARAENLQSEADNKTLNFNEQYQGIKHNRDLELQQAKSSNDLEKQAMKDATAARQQEQAEQSRFEQAMALQQLKAQQSEQGSY